MKSHSCNDADNSQLKISHVIVYSKTRVINLSLFFNGFLHSEMSLNMVFSTNTLVSQEKEMTYNNWMYTLAYEVRRKLTKIPFCAKLFQTISVLPWSTWWGKLLNCSGNKTEFFCHIRMLILASLNLYRIHIRDLGIFTLFSAVFSHTNSVYTRSF